MAEICATQQLEQMDSGCHPLDTDNNPVSGTNGNAAAENGSHEQKNGSSNLSTWGHLLTIHGGYPTISLQKPSILIGRGSSCDVRLPSLKRSQQISTQHFTIMRLPEAALNNGSDSHTSEAFATNGNGDCNGDAEINRKASVSMVTVVRDHSTNGTFVDGVKIGKDKQVVINSNQVISLLSAGNRCWMFAECRTEDDPDDRPELPDSISSRFAVSTQLGEGGFGKVFLAYEIGTCRSCAIKIICKRDMFYMGTVTEVDRAIQTQEVKNLMSIDHPNIIRVLEFINDQDNAFIVLEYMSGGDLYDKIARCGTLTDAQTKHIGYQLARAILHLHDNNISHRDIKPENVLLADKDADMPTVKLTDFGLSKLLHRGTVLRTVCGTPGYTAPEINELEGEQSYTSKCDVWSLGALLFACLFGRSFDADSDSEVLGLAASEDGALVAKPDVSESPISPISPLAASLLQAMLQPLPERRLTMSDVVAHPWFADCRLPLDADCAASFGHSVDVADGTVDAAAAVATGDVSIVSEAASSVVVEKTPLSSEPTTAAEPIGGASVRRNRCIGHASTSTVSAAAAVENSVSDSENAGATQPPPSAQAARRRSKRAWPAEAEAQLVPEAMPAQSEETLAVGAPPAKRWRGWSCEIL